MLLQRVVLPMQVPRLAHRKAKLALLMLPQRAVLPMQVQKPELQKEKLVP